jgi:uncharacterized protein (TIGR00730 family)
MMTPTPTKIATATVYCASSRKTDPAFPEAARRLGDCLARGGVTVVYGGGAVGSMGALADGALAANGRVVGVLPHFMADLEWGHSGVELRRVADMHERKRTMLEGSDAVVALPGGSGTLEELLEVITWKRLGLYRGPIAILNYRGYYDPLLAMLERCVTERFMDDRHAGMWLVVETPEAVLPALQQAPAWEDDPRRFAVP